MLFISLSLFTLFWIGQCNSNDNLQAVVVLFRHGDKTPTTSFPKDPYFNHHYWPMGFGQLTNRGKLRQYNLGRWLRRRYDTFISRTYSPKEIYVISTDVDRTLMSASANLAGLFPPESDQIWRSDLPWQPIPIHGNLDSLVKMYKKCDRYELIFQHVSQGDFFKELSLKYRKDYDFVSNKTGWKVDDVHYFAQLQSVFYCYSSADACSYLPDWYQHMDKKLLDYLAGVHYARQTFTEEMKLLISGPFLNYVFSYFERILTRNKDAPKMLMISGHEETLAAVLNTMNVFDYVPPRFASAVIWELRKNSTTDDEYYINMLYKKNDSGILDMLELERCTFDCSYDKFKKILKHVTVNADEWERKCKDKR